MVFALARESLGPDVEPFASNIDGKSEASFEQLDTHPTERTRPAWDSYGVVQIKHLSDPAAIGSTAAADWVADQVSVELDFWLSEKSRRYHSAKKPTYALFVTNVPIAVGSAEWNRIENEIVSRRAALKLKSAALWSAAHLSKLLDIYAHIRKDYAAFLVPGDALSSLHNYIPGSQLPEVGQAILDHAANELIREQWIRLGQSGSLNNEKRTLDELAVDLAATRRGASRSEIPGVVQYVLECGDHLLRPSHLKHIYNLERMARQSRERRKWRETRRDELRSADASITNEKLREILAAEEKIMLTSERAQQVAPKAPINFVVIGGPGQGKTTLGQLICQAYRVALLAPRPRETLGPAGDTVDKLERRMSELGLLRPSFRRWPIRIALSKLAEMLSTSADRSILRFIAGEISEQTDVKVTASHMETWLGAWPWLLVLDGLDEIAQPALRDRVQAKLSALLVASARLDADLLIVGTTRPQGYLDEFEPDRFNALTLRPLGPPEASAYAQRLREVRHADDPDMQRQLSRGIDEALQDPTTARLMRTPLQVTVMSLLLERRSRAPDNRYQLFDSYYQTIYEREVAKEGLLGALLDDRENDVHFIHQRVALILQSRAETSGETESLMDNDELHELAKARLTSEGMSEPNAAHLAGVLLRAATDRLVLLVPLVQDKIGFEVRSLQEYMAARSLTSGGDGEVLDRLRALAPSSFWRNTWLLAAGNIFRRREREHLRARVVALLSEIDSEGPLPGLLLPSAPLALDLLEDDVPGKAWVYQRIIVRHALLLLALPPTSQLERLAGAVARASEADETTRNIVRQEFEAALRTNDWRRLNAIYALGWWAELSDRSAGWAKQRLVAACRNLSSEERRLFLGGLGLPASSSLTFALTSQTRRPAPRSDDVTGRVGELLRLPVKEKERALARRRIAKIFQRRKLKLVDLRVKESDIRSRAKIESDASVLEVQEELLRWSMELPVEHTDIATNIRLGVEQWYAQRPVSSRLNGVAIEEI